MKVNALTVRHESVQIRIVDDVQSNVFGLETCDFQDRVCPVAKRGFDFSIADQALRRGGHRSSCGDRCDKRALQKTCRHETSPLM